MDALVASPVCATVSKGENEIRSTTQLTLTQLT